MIYMEYDQAAIEFTNRTESETQFIFAIDGSGSMSGQKWIDQLDSLKDILMGLGASQNNHISIIVFDSNATIYCENRDASSINVPAISFPGGGT